MIKKFSELSVGTKFIYNNTEYEKISQVKVSCCKSLNAKSTANEKQRIFVIPAAEVKVVE